jgi:flavin-dependent dehydrogenase
MTNVLAAAEQVRQSGKLVVPAGQGGIAMIDPADIGAVAATILTSNGHAGATYELTGPEAITYADVADELSAITGRRIEFVDVPEVVAQEHLAASGMPGWLVTHLIGACRLIRSGELAVTTSTVRNLIGREPRTFAEFARDHSGAFAESRTTPRREARAHSQGGARYDAIVVGARCAGSPTAMLLAKKGYRVLVVDRATFPSDTISSHVLQPTAVAALSRWGLLNGLLATGCPPLHTYAFDFGPIVITGSPGTGDFPAAYCPRRTILDKLLVDAAVEAGSEVREAFTVDEILFDDDRVTGIRGHSPNGVRVTEHAQVVVGADGWHSVVADAVQPERYHEKPPLLAAYYSYWSGLPMDGRFEIYIRPDSGFGAASTHDGLTLIIGGWSYAEYAEKKRDVDDNFLKMIEQVPAFAERLRGAKREARYLGAALPNYFRKPYGPGWVLVGDAGYIKDSITAQGISDAFHDAERCAQAIDSYLSNRSSVADAMDTYQRLRDQHALPMYELTCQAASLQPPSVEMQQLLAAIQHDQAAMDRFVQMNTGTITPAEFFATAVSQS